MNKLTYISLILVVLIANGCSNKETEQEKQEKQEKQDKQEKQRYEKIVSELSNKYVVKYSLDTIRYNYTIQFNDLLKTDYQLVSRFRIQDIYKNDSTFFVRIQTGILPTYYLNLSIPETEQQKLMNLNKSYLSRANAVLIVRLQEIKKIDLTFDAYPEGQDNYSIEYKNSRSFLGKGQVIEVRKLN